MKNLIPLILAILFIGTGCVLQRPPATPPDVTSPTPPVSAPQNFYGVLEAYDASTGVASVRVAGGGTESIVWPEEAVAPVDKLGAMVTAHGVRDPSTLIVEADVVDFPGSQNLMIVSPTWNATVTSPLIVQGFGRVFEQQFSWRVKDSTGAVLATGLGMTHALEVGWFGPFSFEIFLPALTDPNFTLEVLDYSARDGSEQDLVSVPLSLLSTKTTSFKVYFLNAAKGSAQDCENVFSVDRTVAETSAVGRAAITELLVGPTSEERAAGYSTSLSPYVALRSLVVSDGVAKVDFNEFVNPAGGSCAVQAVRSQIEHTLLQFPLVESVVISVNGNVDTALQP